MLATTPGGLSDAGQAGRTAVLTAQTTDEVYGTVTYLSSRAAFARSAVLLSSRRCVTEISAHGATGADLTI
jgi:hypothetical protein